MGKSQKIITKLKNHSDIPYSIIPGNYDYDCPLNTFKAKKFIKYFGPEIY